MVDNDNNEGPECIGSNDPDATGFIDKLYHHFLWVFGFAYKEHISDMLARMRIRWGWIWYVITIGTLTAEGILMGKFGWWWLIPVWIGGIVLWIHIIDYIPKSRKAQMFSDVSIKDK